MNKVHKDNNLERVTTNGCGADNENSLIFLKNVFIMKQRTSLVSDLRIKDTSDMLNMMDSSSNSNSVTEHSILVGFSFASVFPGTFFYSNHE